MTANVDKQETKTMDPPEIALSDTHNIVLRVYELSQPNTSASDDSKIQTQRKIVARFAVNREVLIENSEFFEKLFSERWSRAGQTTYDLGERHVEALEVWLRCLHNTLTDASYSVAIEDVWHAVSVSEKYFFMVEKLFPWFNKWLQKNGGDLHLLPKFNMEQLRSLIYPCHHFENARGLATVTRRLAYEGSGHITEINPTVYRHMRVRNVLMGSLNGAQGSLRTRIHKEIYQQRTFLRSTCECKEKGLFEYERALDNTKVWSIEEALMTNTGKCINDVLDGLEKFTYTSPNNDCRLCSKDFRTEILDAVARIRSYFHGICWDCLDEDEERDWEKEYENQRTSQGDRWDRLCRIRHDQPTWYFSWLSRKPMENAHEKERQIRRLNAKQAERAKRFKDYQRRELMGFGF